MWFTPNRIARSLALGALLVIILLLMIARHFVPAGHDTVIALAVFPLVALSTYFIDARARRHFQERDRASAKGAG